MTTKWRAEEVDYKELRHQIAALPDSADRPAMQEFVAHEEALHMDFKKSKEVLEKMAAAHQGRVRQGKLVGIFGFLPIALGACYYLLVALWEGEIKNFVSSGDKGHFWSDTGFPLVSFQGDPYLFCILAGLYACFSAAFLLAAFSGITGRTVFFGKERSRGGKADFERRLELAEQEERHLKTRRFRQVKLFELFGQTFYDTRIPIGIVLGLSTVFVGAIIYGILR